MVSDCIPVPKNNITITIAVTSIKTLLSFIEPEFPSPRQMKNEKMRSTFF
jgi:hypothetical protein